MEQTNKLDLDWHEERDLAESLARLDKQIATWGVVARRTLERVATQEPATAARAAEWSNARTLTAAVGEANEKSAVADDIRLEHRGREENIVDIQVEPATTAPAPPPAALDSDAALLASLDTETRAWVLVRQRISNRPVRELVAEFEANHPKKR